jgi:hypothetical protein
MRTRSVSAADLAGLLDHWISADIISREQADRIREDRAQAPRRQDHTGSLVTEAMGYLGGVIVVVGLGLVLGRFWPDLTAFGRIGLAGAVAAILLAAGAVVPGRAGAAGVRLRGVLWLAGSLSVFACLALVADRLGWSGDRLLAFAAGGAAVVSAPLWVLHRRILQQAALLAFVIITAAAWTSMTINSNTLPGVAVWFVGVVCFVLGEFALMQPARGAQVLSAVALIIGSVWVEGEWWGTAMALATVAGLVTVAVLGRDLVLLSVASVGTLVVLPVIVLHYFPGVLSAALTLVIAGLALVGLAVLTARRRPAKTTLPA